MIKNYLIFNVVAIYAIWCLTASPSFAPNPIYSSAGSHTFDTSGYLSNGTSVVNPVTFAITFASRTKSTTTYQFGYTIQQISYTITSSRINYTIYLDTKTATSVSMKLYATSMNKITKLIFAYIIIEPLFGIYSFINYVLKPGRDMIPTTPYSETTTGQGPFASTTNKLYISIIGVDALLKVNSQIDLYAYAETPSTTSVTYRISTITDNAFFLTSVMFSVFIYNENAVLTANRGARWTTGTQIKQNGLTYSSSIIQSYNTIYGLQGIHLKNEAILFYKTTITPGVSVTATTGSTYFWFGFSYLIVQFVFCAPATPYYMVSSKLCYDVCLIRYYIDQYNECTLCANYDCEYCLSSGPCTSCSSTLHFRSLNTVTRRCVPLSGYYDDGTNTVAVICVTTNCLTCTSATLCLSCATGKYLTGTNTCVACMSNCLSCTSGSDCQTCATFYTFTTSCLITCASITNCNACSVHANSSLICSACNAGYSLVSNACTSVCGNAYKLSPEQCDDGNTVSGDGCSSTCTIQSRFYCTENPSNRSTCAACISNCQICSDSTTCSTCISSFAVINNSCVNISGVVCGNRALQITESCDDGNLLENDGCNKICKVESNYRCSNVSGALSVCNIQKIDFTLTQIRKDPFSNNLMMTYSIEPSRNPLYSTQQWQTIITQISALNLNITSAFVNEEKTLLSVNMNIGSNLNGQQIRLKYTLPNAAPFQLIHSDQIVRSSLLEESYNQSIDVFPSGIYDLAIIMQKICIVLSILSFIFFFMGYYISKIIVLECLYVFHIAYYSLICVNGLSPIQYSLTSLRYSTGVNLHFFSYAKTHRKLQPVNLSLNFLNNYNITSAVILLPFLMSFIISFANMMRKSQKIQLMKIKLRKELTFYGIMFSLYTIFTSCLFFLMYTDLRNIEKESIVAIATNMSFVVLILIFTLTFLSDPQSFGEFSSQLQKAKRYYGFVFAEKVIISASFFIFIFLTSFTFTLLVISAIVLAQIIIVFLYSPYSNAGRTTRPLLNTLSSLTILLLQFVPPYIDKSVSAFLPAAIVGVLILNLICNVYYYFKQRQQVKQMLKVQMINESFQVAPDDSKRSKRSNSKMDLNKNIRIFFNHSYGDLNN